MNVDFETIDLAAIKPNSLVILRAPIDALTDSGMGQIARTAKSMKDKLDPSIHLLVMPDDMKVEVLDEEMMNKAGWYRFNVGMDLANEPDETAETRAEEKKQS